MYCRKESADALNDNVVPESVVDIFLGKQTFVMSQTAKSPDALEILKLAVFPAPTEAISL